MKWLQVRGLCIQLGAFVVGASTLLACRANDIARGETTGPLGSQGSGLSTGQAEPQHLAFRISLVVRGQSVPLQLELAKTPALVSDDYVALRYDEQGQAHRRRMSAPSCLYGGELFAVSPDVPAEFLDSSERQPHAPSPEAPVRILGSFASISTCSSDIDRSIQRPQAKGWVSAFGKIWHLQVAATPSALDRYRLLEVHGVRSNTAAPLGPARYTELLRVAPTQPLLQDFESIREGTPQETKYIQIVMVNDQARVERLGNQTEDDTIAHFHMVNALYARSGLTPRTRVVLAGQVSFEVDPYAANLQGQEVDSEDLLDKFGSWGADAELPEHDLRILMSGFDFVGDVAGLAPVGAVCLHEQNALVAETRDSRSTPVIVAHEIGHTLGMGHDGQDNNCAARGFIMAAVACSNCNDNISLFSECSLRDYANYLSSGPYRQLGLCLDDLPMLSAASACGDGVVSAGEQCDCGEEDCASVDPCCDGVTCQLVTDAECSNFSDSCCLDCRVARAEEMLVCREARSACDTAEVCGGHSKACPPDTFNDAGQSCKDTAGNEGACYLGLCQTLGANCATVSELLGTELLAPSEQCPWSCGEVACESNEFGCVQVTDLKSSDGTPCGAGKQCLRGECTTDLDQCPLDDGKLNPGVCGCGSADVDTDGDQAPDCLDSCPNDRAKVSAGDCGCGVPDTDDDGDKVPDCDDLCAEDPLKAEPGECGCGALETGDMDGDGTPDCRDECARDPSKTDALACGCGEKETDNDGDGTPDCVDRCPGDPAKVTPEQCGCGVSEVDSDDNGAVLCGQQACAPAEGCAEDGPRVEADTGASCSCHVGQTQGRFHGAVPLVWMGFVALALGARRRPQRKLPPAQRR